MFRRIPIIIVAIVIVVILAIPYVIGLLNENAMRSQLDYYESRAFTTASVESLDRGWFSSRVQLKYGFDPNDSTDAANPIAMVMPAFSLPFVVEIEHGPILRQDGFGLGAAAFEAYLDPDSDLGAMAQRIFGLERPFHLHGRSDFGLGYTYEGEIAPIDLALADFSVESTGVRFAASNQEGRQTFDADLESLSVQSMFLTVILDVLNLSSDLERAVPGQLPLGNSGLSIAHLTVSEPLQGTNGTISMDGLGATLSYDETDGGEYLDLGIVYSLDKLSLPNEMDISDASLGMSLGHLDADSVNAVYRLIESYELLATGVPPAMEQELLAAIDTMLAGQPRLTLEPLSFSMPQGRLTGLLTVTIDPAAIPAGEFSDLSSAGVALGSAMVAELYLTASKRLVQHLFELALISEFAGMAGSNGEPMPPDQIESLAASQVNLTLLTLTAQDLVSDEGGDYTTTIRLANGTTTANGQPLDLLGF